jgi:hypothetical protein
MNRSIEAKAIAEHEALTTFTNTGNTRRTIRTIDYVIVAIEAWAGN